MKSGNPQGYEVQNVTYVASSDVPLAQIRHAKFTALLVFGCIISLIHFGGTNQNARN